MERGDEVLKARTDEAVARRKRADDIFEGVWVVERKGSVGGLMARARLGWRG